MEYERELVVRTAGALPVVAALCERLGLVEAVERMHRQDLTTLPVTSSEGRLLGLLERGAAEQALRELNRNSARTLAEPPQP